MALEYKSHALPYFNERPESAVVDTVVVHSMFARNANQRFSPDKCIEVLSQCCVSAHYLIARDGQIWKLVEEDKRAWHAGVSKMPDPEDARDNVNNFSIGIELIGNGNPVFTEEQYGALAALISDLSSRHPIRFVLGHKHIAPVRKTDPEGDFNWEMLQEKVLTASSGKSHISFGWPYINPASKPETSSVVRDVRA